MTDYTKQLYTANVMHDKGYSEDEAKAYIQGIIDCGFNELYEALKALADSSSPISPKVAHEMADKALAKAEGK